MLGCQLCAISFKIICKIDIPSGEKSFINATAENFTIIEGEEETHDTNKTLKVRRHLTFAPTSSIAEGG